MKNDTAQNIKQESTHVISGLLQQHQAFHRYLDLITSSSKDAEMIRLLIQIRRFNIECVSRYTGLLSKTSTARHRNFRLGAAALALVKVDDQTLWSIHTQLSRLIPYYQNALSHRQLGQIQRMIVARNLDKLVAIKEELLHPVAEVEYS